MNTVGTTNRLSETKSPYLQQHADNPVNWQPWDEETLQFAQETDKPIFLSVGYAACHWCHVMAEESFEDEEVAAVLNESFVPIKVDREERPDINKLYQTICQLVTGGGGWPLSAWLTPTGEPFYIGTYFPKNERSDRGNVPGFLNVCQSLATGWQEDREEILNRAEQWAEALDNEMSPASSRSRQSNSRAEDDSSLHEDVAQTALRAVDEEYGGFGSGEPKFPQPRRIEMLLESSHILSNEDYKRAATTTLDEMAAGGIYDHVGGGFHRYSTDRRWAIPHFEKMLYDNAELARIYTLGFQITGRTAYARIAKETTEFAIREFKDSSGGFYSTLDAQTEGVEGKYYVWTPTQIRDAVENERLAELALSRYGITSTGNFEGSNVLSIESSIPELAQEFDVSESQVVDQLETIRGRLFDLRDSRVRPHRDEKILASWNGLMISALAHSGFVLNESAYLDEAQSTLQFLQRTLWDDSKNRLSRRVKDGAVGGPGFLDDYAFLSKGAFDLYQFTGNIAPLEFSLRLARELVDSFYDRDEETLYLTPRSAPDLVSRPQELTDQSTPSSVGVACSVLADLDPLAPTDDFAEIASDVLDTHQNQIRGRPLEHITMAREATRHQTTESQLIVATQDTLPSSIQTALQESYLPDTTISRRPATESALEQWCDQLDLDTVPSLWKNRVQRHDKATLYACTGGQCSRPTSDISEAVASLSQSRSQPHPDEL